MRCVILIRKLSRTLQQTDGSNFNTTINNLGSDHMMMLEMMLVENAYDYMTVFIISHSEFSSATF